MRWLPKTLLLTCLAAVTALPAWALELGQFRQLVVLQDAPVADILVEKVAWLGDHRGLVAGGWEQWPSKPMVLVAVVGSQPMALRSPAAPHFALSPSRDRVAYWVATGGGWSQLAIAPLPGGGPRYVGEPRRIGPAMHLAWTTEYSICTLIQNKGVSTAFAINAATGLSRPLVKAEGGQWTGLRAWPGWDPIAVWVGNQKRCFRLVPLGRSEEISADFDHDRARPDAKLSSYFAPSGGLWLAGLESAPVVKVAEDAGAACWAPDGSMLMYASRGKLSCTWPEPMEQRRLAGSALDDAGLEAAPPLGMSWAADGGAFAYWRQSGARGQLRRARLGLEEVLIRVRFEPGQRTKVGQPLWVAMKLYFDEQGHVKEPVWETLKGQFAVRKLLPGAEQNIVEAVSIGGQAGVLRRIAGRDRPEPGAIPTRTPPQFNLKPIPGLYAWPQEADFAGEVIGVEVRLVPLGSGG